MLMLSTRLIINMEEFDSLTPEALAELKHLIAQDLVLERKAFDTDLQLRATSLIRRQHQQSPLPAGHRREPPLPVQQHLVRGLSHPHLPCGHLRPGDGTVRNGFHYWYEGDEINQLNQRNEHFRLKEPVEENLYYYYRPARPAEGGGKWLPAAQLLATISLNGRVLQQATQQTSSPYSMRADSGTAPPTTESRVCRNGTHPEQRNENAVQPVVENRKNEYSLKKKNSEKV